MEKASGGNSDGFTWVETFEWRKGRLRPGQAREPAPTSQQWGRWGGGKALPREHSAGTGVGGDAV